MYTLPSDILIFPAVVAVYIAKFALFASEFRMVKLFPISGRNYWRDDSLRSNDIVPRQQCDRHFIRFRWMVFSKSERSKSDDCRERRSLNRKFYVEFTVAQVEYVRDGDSYLPDRQLQIGCRRGHGYFYRVHSSRIYNSPLSVLPRLDHPPLSTIFRLFEPCPRINRNILSVSFSQENTSKRLRAQTWKESTATCT